MTNDNTPWTPPAGARIDWPKVLDDIAYLLGEPRQDNPLLRDAVSQEKLAKHLQYPRGTVRYWMDGGEPKHGDGEVLIQHWTRLTGKARTFIHVDRFVFSAAKASATKQRREPGDHGAAAAFAV